MLGEQGEGMHQEFEVKDLRKALSRLVCIQLLYLGKGGREIQTYKYWSTGEVMTNTTMTYLHKRKYIKKKRKH